ncbi:hypothetical protein BDZ89DRAFT_547446 [Hymenopellis radicata]|nr:hypothetical protein BDZ89DRAFT_547446 [Hymenopellis radicata]
MPRNAISKIAGKLWRALSKAEQLDWEVLADEEKALHTTRFPGYVYLEKKRVKDDLEWSAANDDVFVIDEQGAIRYGPPSQDEDVPVVAPKKGARAGKKGARTGTKVAPAPVHDPSASNEDAPAVEEYTWLYFPWEIEGMGYQNINGTMPYALMPPPPMDVALTGVYADDFLPQLPFGDDPIQSGQTRHSSTRIPLPWNMGTTVPGSSFPAWWSTRVSFQR